MDADTAERIAIDDEPDCEGHRRVDRGDVRYRLGAPGALWDNGVEYARWRHDEVRDRVRELEAVFAANGGRYTWAIGPNTDAPGLAAELAARGLRKQADALIVTARIPIAGRRPAHDLRLVEERDERTVRDALRVDRDRALEGEALHGAVARRLAYLACPTRRGGGVVAYRGELAVGYGAWRDASDGDAVYLAGAVTLRPHRRTGVYTAILGWRLDRAARAGRSVAVAVAERATSAPILLRLGFREVGGRQIWVARSS